MTFCGPQPRGTARLELQQVKGTHYSLHTFLGKSVSQCAGVVRRGGELYQMVIYLPPGSYHRFHSPTHWRISRLAHIWGERLSVAPPVLKHIKVREDKTWNFQTIKKMSG